MMMNMEMEMKIQKMMMKINKMMMKMKMMAIIGIN
jgi:hypothetical protein